LFLRFSYIVIFYVCVGTAVIVKRFMVLVDLFETRFIAVNATKVRSLRLYLVFLKFVEPKTLY